MSFDIPLQHCPICGSSNICYWQSKKKNEVNYLIYCCKRCTGGFLNPRPSDDALKTIYNISGHGLTRRVTCDEILENEKEFPNSTVDAQRMIRISKKLYGQAQENRASVLRLLDIGSGFGFFSLCAKENGFDVVSVNPGEYENFVHTDLFHLNGCSPNILAGMFEDFDFKSESYDVVIASQVFEHVKDPVKMIAKIERILRPGGILAVAVPNFNSLFVRVLSVREQGCLWVPEHCNYFTKKSFKKMVEKTTLKPRITIDIAKIPYFAIGNRLHLKRNTLGRTFVNKSFQFFQYPICRVMEVFGVGNYFNIFFKKVK